MLYKMDMLCIDSSIYSVVNIRLTLKGFEFKNRHAKLIRRNDKKFSTKIGKVSLNEQKEELYQSHKKRFKGFIHATLSDYLEAGRGYTVFNTREVCIYSGSQLVAVSYIDLGENSVASLLCLFDHEYASASLGIYTMLKEIEYCQVKGFKLYYPGYILDNQESFNYKLSLGKVEYYNANKRWTTLVDSANISSPASVYKDAMQQIGLSLKDQGIEFRQWIYPYFSMGYMGYWNVDFLKYPFVFEISFGFDGSPQLLLSFDVELNQYILLTTQVAHSHEHLITMEISSEFRTEHNYLLHLLKTNQIFCKTKSIKQMVLVVQSIVNKAPNLQNKPAQYLIESIEA
jgi:leucyl-tRNA---protein transferase